MFSQTCKKSPRDEQWKINELPFGMVDAIYQAKQLTRRSQP
jgi:hypothetical protein